MVRYSRRDDGKRIMEWLSKNEEGGTVDEIAHALSANWRRVAKLLRGFESAGEVWWDGRRWRSTSAFLRTSRKNVILQMKSELEEAIFGNGGPSDRVMKFLEEYSTARRLGLEPREAYYMAMRTTAVLPGEVPGPNRLGWRS